MTVVETIDLVFTGPPGPDPATCGFVEAERPDGTGVNVGEWIERDDGAWILRLQATLPPRSDSATFGNLGIVGPVAFQGGVVFLRGYGCRRCGQGFWTEDDSVRRLPTGVDHACPHCGATSTVDIEQGDPWTMLEVVKGALRARGYVEVEPSETGGGVWKHPSWDGGAEKIVSAIVDAFEEGR